MTVTIKQRGGVWYLSGTIDESFKFMIPNLPGPTRIDMSGVVGVSSNGVANFVAFTESWTGRKVVYEECSWVMVEALHMVPMLLGPKENQAEIKSFQVLFSCGDCRQQDTYSLHAADVRAKSGEEIFSSYHCSRCQAVTEPISRDQMVWMQEIGAFGDSDA